MKRRKKNWMTAARKGIGREGAKQRKILWDRVMGGRKKKSAHRGSAKAPGGSREEVASALVNLGYSKPAARTAARSASGSDFESLFRSALGSASKKNPRVFLGNLSGSEISALRKLVRQKTMATKKRRRKKKNSSRKGKMPAGLRKYWAKKRAAKAKRRNPKKRRKARVSRPRRKRTSLRVRNYRRTARKPKARRRRARKSVRRSNPRRGTIRIKAPAGLGPKGLRKFAAMARKAYGAPTRIVRR